MARMKVRLLEIVSGLQTVARKEERNESHLEYEMV